ncbi:MAG: ABC transporter ATP-binding protein [Bacteroidetes bacterium]|uniref:ABC transporter ATP-binding protein n=1 Tax=Candidatus Pullibacteroides excrementavium TaxID=2840905 RepID=A0A9D9DRP3_9BACT|nr:ABC transporter ATP-binding protein [Candidatus Pullibacteroides excrementavium]
MLFKHSFFYRYVAPYTGRLLFNVLLRVLSALFTLVLTIAIAPLLALLFDTGKAESAMTGGGLAQSGMELLENWVHLSVVTNGKYETLLYVVLALLSAYFLKNLCAYMGLYLFIPIRNQMVARLRNDMFHKFMILPLSFYANQQKGDLISRISNNTQDVDTQMLNQIQQVMVDVVTFIFLIAALFFISTPLTICVLILLPLIGVLTSFLSRSLKRKSKRLQDTIGHISAQVTESLEGIKTLRSYNTTGYALRKFEAENALFFKLNTRVFRRLYSSHPLNEVLGTTAVALILVIGGYLILSDKSLRPEAFITYLVTMIQILPTSKNIMTAYFTYQSGKGSWMRIKEVLKADEVILEKKNAAEIHDIRQSIRFENVGFTYGKKPTLKNIDLELPKGRFIALVGPSGGGKSTIINLIPRFFDPVSGKVLFDGKDIADCKIDCIRALSSLVSQDTVLFNDTIYNNILLGNPQASREEVIQAAKMADAHDFIMATSNGYDTLIGDSGTKLSGGQRQRLSIARALVKKAPVLLFDEATSALDTEAECRIMQAVQQAGKQNGQTIVSVAHRLSSIRQADEIIVIEEGEIVGRGTHEELYEGNSLYRKLCQMQNLDNRTTTPQARQQNEIQ